MSSATSDNAINSSSNSSIDQINPYLQFWFFLISDMFSLIWTLFALYHLLLDRQLRTTLHNHILIVILLLIFIIETIDIPLQLQFFLTGIVRPTTDLTCRFWIFIDWGFYNMISVSLAFAAIERHILIFHSTLVATKRKRLIIHYIPMLVIFFFMFTFYSIVIFAPICETTFDYTDDICGLAACYKLIPVFTMIEQLGFGISSYLWIIIYNMGLLVRVIRQKYRIHRAVQWRKQRKLVLQTLSISLLFLIFSVPVTMVYVVRLFGPSDWAYSAMPILFFLSYYSIFLLPCVCLGNIPDLWKKIKQCIPRYRRVAAINI